MSVVLRNWARQVRSLSGFPHQRGPFVTPEMCPHFLLMSMTMSSTPKDAFAPVSESLHPGIPFLASFFRPKPSVSSHWGAETLLGYHSLISGSYRGRPLSARFSKGHPTTTTTNEYFCINLISSRAFSGSKEGGRENQAESRIRSIDGWRDRTFLYKNQIIGEERRTDRGLEAKIPVVGFADKR